MDKRKSKDKGRDRIIDLQKYRKDKTEERKREYERLLFNRILGVYSFAEREELHHIEVVDVSFTGIKFREEKPPTPLKEGQKVTLRFYFTPSSFLRLPIQVKRVKPFEDDGRVGLEYGCEIDKKTKSYIDGKAHRVHGAILGDRFARSKSSDALLLSLSRPVKLLFFGFIALYGAEIALTWKHAVVGATLFYNPASRFFPSAKAEKIPFDTRMWDQVVRDFRSSGTHAHPFIHPTHFLKHPGGGLSLDNGRSYLPLGGIANAFTVYQNETGSYLTYESDEHGFHNPRGLYRAGKLDAAFIGDSFSHGCCVASEKNVAGIFRERSETVLNLGVGDNGPLREYATFREYLAPLKPKHVYWLFFGPDIIRLGSELSNPILQQYRQPGFRQGLRTVQTQIDTALKTFSNERLEDASHRPSVYRAAWKNIWSPNSIRRMLVVTNVRDHLKLQPSVGWADASEVRQEYLDVLKELLQKTMAELGTWKGELTFVYLPEQSRFGQNGYRNAYRLPILEIAHKSGAHVVDFEEVMVRDSDPLRFFPFRQYGHLNADGYRLLAETLLAKK